ncbi:MAG: DUF1549 domain-containing protein [Planctomycetia bacterium]|nr:DUF1549 domain-containing protein [Planctomycetia bacterium]
MHNSVCSWFRFMLVLMAVSGPSFSRGDDAPGVIDFAHDIQPLFNKRCVKCHSGPQRKGGLSINTRQSLLAGGESGRVAVPGKSADSLLIKRVSATDAGERMPPEGEPLTKAQIETLQRWIDADLPWEDGFAFGKLFRRAPIEPRRPQIPAGDAEQAGVNPIDRFLHKQISNPKPQHIDNRTFARRAFLDLIGLLPTPAELDAFDQDSSPEKREKLIDRLLDDRRNYADHWLSFWNDLLRNAYQGTGFIDGGRRQITGWLYESLLKNKPYDQFVRELIEAAPGAEGFTFGIKWRGTVNESQRREIQAAQSIAQVFLGTNLKCASCHDSFVNDWKLADAYGLASVFADSPLELHRCDKPTGKASSVAFLYPQVGQIETTANRPQRQQQLANLLTKPENGRFARAIVNRLWAKLFGRGLIEPLDNLDAEPWHADLLDFLASDLVDHGYDLKQTLRLMATSRAYQLPSVGLDETPTGDEPFAFRGPQAKRLTAEQFVDAVTSLTNTWRPISLPLLRVDGRGQGGQVGAAARALRNVGHVSNVPSSAEKPTEEKKADEPKAEHVGNVLHDARWIWPNADALNAPGESSVFFRKRLKLDQPSSLVIATITADNSFEFFINGRKVAAGDAWQTPTQVVLQSPLNVGENILAVKVTNGGKGPNAAGFIAELFGADASGHVQWTISTDDTWLASETESKGWEHSDFDSASWTAAVIIGDSTIAPWKIAEQLKSNGTFLTREDLIAVANGARLRAALLPQDQLQAALGRPHREQIVSHRESLATMLQSLELTNGTALDEQLQRGAEHWRHELGPEPSRLISGVYAAALGRKPTVGEQSLAADLLGSPPTKDGIADLLWAIVLLPEFQLAP